MQESRQITLQTWSPITEIKICEHFKMKVTTQKKEQKERIGELYTLHDI